jgi:hypothetical protein
MAQRAIRFSETNGQTHKEATEKGGFSPATAFIPYAVEQELSWQKEKLVTAEERLVTSTEQVKGELLVLPRSVPVFVGKLSRQHSVTCIPEPDIQMLDAPVARAQGRHARLLKSAGQAMGADSRLATQELVNHEEREFRLRPPSRCGGSRPLFSRDACKVGPRFWTVTAIPASSSSHSRIP